MSTAVTSGTFRIYTCDRLRIIHAVPGNNIIACTGIKGGGQSDQSAKMVAHSKTNHYNYGLFCKKKRIARKRVAATRYNTCSALHVERVCTQRKTPSW